MSTMKRLELFIVKSTTKGVLSKKYIESNPYQSKWEAKDARDLLGGPSAGFYVSLGPDHRNYKGGQ